MLSTSIYRILISIECDKRHVDRYVRFLELCERMNRDLTECTYTEQHHILPQALFPELRKEKVYLFELTARQHFIAHMILHKAYGGVMSKAFHKFQTPSHSKRASYPKITAKQYSVLREEVVRWSSAYFTGRKVSKETRLRQSEAQKKYIERLREQGRKHHNSRPFSEEHKKALSKARRGFVPYNTSYYDVYDNDGQLRHTFFGNLRDMCKQLGMPADEMISSYLNGGLRVYSKTKITKKALDKGYDQYKDWYVIKRAQGV